MNLTAAQYREDSIAERVLPYRTFLGHYRVSRKCGGSQTKADKATVCNFCRTFCKCPTIALSLSTRRGIDYVLYVAAEMTLLQSFTSSHDFWKRAKLISEFSFAQEGINMFEAPMF